MNDYSDTLRSFNRFELKYLLDLRQAEQFKKDIVPYLIPDNHGSDNGRYTITSLYYDSPNLCCYREKVDGLKFRRKLRIRRYENAQVLTEETPVYVEIKQRYDRVTQKRRAILTYGESLRLCNDRQIPKHAPDDSATIEEIYTFCWQYHLQPTSIVRYKRQAFVGSKYEPGLRVTFDTDLTYQMHHIHLHEPYTGTSMLAPNLVVLEIKINERLPRWLADLIARHNLSITRVSKYCLSIEQGTQASMPLPHRWAPRRSQEILATAPSLFSNINQLVIVRK